MSNIYNIDFSLVAERVSPPSKRTSGILSWFKSLLSPLQWLRNTAMDYYVNGVPQHIAPFYDDAASYNYGDWVVFGDDRVYQNIYPGGSTVGILPTDTAYWMPVLDTYIGVRERMVYNSQTIVLEGLLNKKFRVPPEGYDPGEPPVAFPLIYIDNKDNDLDFVYLYNQAEGYMGVYFYNSTEEPESPVYFYYEDEYIPEFDYIVNVPVELQTYYPPAPFNTSSVELSKLVEAETAKYNLLGMKFKVEYFPEIEE